MFRDGAFCASLLSWMAKSSHVCNYEGHSTGLSSLRSGWMKTSSTIARDTRHLSWQRKQLLATDGLPSTQPSAMEKRNTPHIGIRISFSSVAVHSSLFAASSMTWITSREATVKTEPTGNWYGKRKAEPSLCNCDRPFCFALRSQLLVRSPPKLRLNKSLTPESWSPFIRPRASSSSRSADSSRLIF